MLFGLFPAQEVQLAINMLFAGVLGGLIGLEREYKQHAAGLRTLILVSVGTALFAATATFAFGAASEGASRIIANIVVGLGFLGSGAVLKTDDSVKGLTTAASIWAAAAIAVAVALNLYFLAIVAEIIVLVTLFVLRRLEKQIPTAPEKKDSDNGT